jgi:hypothetical protein
MVWDHVDTIWINSMMKRDEKLGLMRSHGGAHPEPHPTGSLTHSHLFGPFSLILSQNLVKLRLLNSEQRGEHWERIILEKKNQVWSTEKWLRVREIWWYSLRHTSTSRTYTVWIACGLFIYCGWLSTSVGSTEARLRARETREDNEILWLPLHVGVRPFFACFAPPLGDEMRKKDTEIPPERVFI